MWHLWKSRVFCLPKVYCFAAFSYLLFVCSVTFRLIPLNFITMPQFFKVPMNISFSAFPFKLFDQPIICLDCYLPPQETTRQVKQQQWDFKSIDVFYFDEVLFITRFFYDSKKSLSISNYEDILLFFFPIQLTVIALVFFWSILNYFCVEESSG